MQLHKIGTAIGIVLATICIVMVLQGQSAIGQDKGKDKPGKTQWEYKVIDPERTGFLADSQKLEEDLGKLGRDGWELVGRVGETAEMKGSEAHVTLRIVSELISATRNKAGEVIDGDPETVAEVKDVWTFARDTRSKDPNWKLVATEAED